jgi:hypothetical protein
MMYRKNSRIEIYGEYVEIEENIGKLSNDENSIP